MKIDLTEIELRLLLSNVLETRQNLMDLGCSPEGRAWKQWSKLQEKLESVIDKTDNV